MKAAPQEPLYVIFLALWLVIIITRELIAKGSIPDAIAGAIIVSIIYFVLRRFLGARVDRYLNLTSSVLLSSTIVSLVIRPNEFGFAILTVAVAVLIKIIVKLVATIFRRLQAKTTVAKKSKAIYFQNYRQRSR
ncbi:hypothetical protein FWH09_01500 [Candidatus Saccharibacteria bacterium]|nr:hypothetical protein [Candidatus Saccharibacteria bacterium]